MAHEKVFGFCENLCETEVEQISNKVTDISSSSTDDQYPSAKAVYGELNQFEKASNKVTGISSSSTDTQYPSAKAVYNTFEKASNKVTSISSSSTGDQYPSAKLVYSYLNKMRVGDEGPNWKNAAVDNMQWYFYESADTSINDLPSSNCIVVVFKKTATRGAAFAFGWEGTSTNKTLWKNTNHDGWRGWTQLHTN